MGSYEKSLVQQMMRDGTPLPDRIVNRPRLSEGLQYILESFFDLDGERHHGNGLQRIPWSSIVRYAKHYDLTFDETEEFVYLITQMDQAVLSRLAAKQKADMAKK